ncbi:helix-turn-helix domain-containing protein [Streptomyces sp. NPDC020883]|uniref:helix-turn-helix domain-containing protein n=1 Tax=Streptomyces sp. NPDC020883 TaxID=3365099 RepID=UPI00379A321B
MPDEQSDASSHGGGSAVWRTDDILGALQKLQQQLGRAVFLREVASETGLPTSTTCRYLQVLLEKGRVHQPEGRRGAYLLDQLTVTSAGNAQPHASQAIRRALITLQTRTGQAALLYAPFALTERPLRVCVEQQWGMLTPVADDRLYSAPIGIDPPGHVLAAAMRERGHIDTESGDIRNGYIMGPSVLEGHDAIAAPLWRGSNVAGAVTLMPMHLRMRSAKSRSDYITQVLNTAATMTDYLNRLPTMRAA